MKRLLPALLIAFILACPSGCYVKQMKQVDVSVDNERAAISRCVEFLLTTQNTTGTWGLPDGSRPGQVFVGTQASHQGFEAATTALVCMALLEAHDLGFEVKQPLQKAIDFLYRLEPSRRSVPRELYSIWSLIFTTQCLARCVGREVIDIPDEDIRERIKLWVRRMARCQAADGGWAYYDFRIGAQKPDSHMVTSFSTGSMLVTINDIMNTGVQVPPHLIHPAVKSVQRLRTPNKTYIYGNYLRLRPAIAPNEIKGSLGRAQVGNLALYLFDAGVSVDDMILGLDRLFEHHHFIEIGRGRPYPHEAWYATAGYYYFYGHYYAAAVIQQLPPDTQQKYWAQLSQVILNSQQQDGSWWDFPMYGYYKHYGSGFALYTLIQCYKARNSK
ncbi:hypothetical protein ACFL54_01415 [Planctomycetota bacterium]